MTSVATAAIFRSEVGLLFGPVFIEALLKRRIQFGKTVVLGIAALAGAIGKISLFICVVVMLLGSAERSCGFFLLEEIVVARRRGFLFQHCRKP